VAYLAFVVLFVAGTLYAQQEPVFGWNARVQHYAYRTYSWQRLTLLGGDTGFDHLLGDPNVWGRGVDGFFCRYSANFGRRMVSTSVELGVGALLKEDYRMRPSGRRGLLPRVRYAAVRSLLGPDNRVLYSRLAATSAGVAVSSTWGPGPLTGSRIASAVGTGVIDQFQNNLLTEFGPDVSAFAKRIGRRLLGRPRNDFMGWGSRHN